jgi:hypothetical protein
MPSVSRSVSFISADRTSRIHCVNSIAGFDDGKLKKLPVFAGYLILTIQPVTTHFAY